MKLTSVPLIIFKKNYGQTCLTESWPFGELSYLRGICAFQECLHHHQQILYNRVERTVPFLYCLLITGLQLWQQLSFTLEVCHTEAAASVSHTIGSSIMLHYFNNTFSIGWLMCTFNMYRLDIIDNRLTLMTKDSQIISAGHNNLLFQV